MLSSRTTLVLSSLAVASAMLSAASPAGQAPRVLDKPQVELAEPFTNVAGVRELSDGRVIVVDNGDRAVYVVDFKAGTSTQVGRPGGGPAEYRAPGTLLSLARDTTLLTDAGNRRLLVIGPDAKPIGVLTDEWPAPSGQPGTRLPRAIDAQGRGYFMFTAGRPPINGTVIQSDSAVIVRAARGSSVEDSLGYVQRPPSRITTAMKDGKIASVNIMTPPFSAQDSWTVFADGAVAIVRVSDYRVDWFLPDGRRVGGRPIPFDPVRVTERDKQALSAAASGRGGGAGAGGGGPSPAQVLEYPDFKPPFPGNGAIAASDGRLWVQRYGAATDARSHYDVFDRRGIVVARVDVPDGGRVVGFGPRSIYVVRKDSDDLQYLQRFAL